MPLKYLRSFDMGTIATAASTEKTWTPNEDVHIKRVYIVERSAQNLASVDFYLKVGDKVLTRDFAPASLFGQDPLFALDVDVSVSKGTEIYWKLENKGSSSVDIVVVFEVVEAV